MTESGKTNKNEKKQKGYSFELVVACVIVIALATFLVPTYFKYINIAKVTLAKNTAYSLKDAIESYRNLHKEYPASINFSTGKDSTGNFVFHEELLSQISDDFFSIDSYIGTADSYTLIIKVSDKNHTVIKHTSSKIAD